MCVNISEKLSHPCIYSVSEQFLDMKKCKIFLMFIISAHFECLL